MAGNTLTGQINNIYEALDIVSREMIGFIPAVSKNSSAEMAAKGQTIRIPIAPATGLTLISPANVSPDTGEQTIGYTDMTISKAYMAPVKWNGEEQKSLEGRAGNIMRDQFAQAFRALSNQVETDLGSLYKYASRAYGTSATTPFGSSLEDAAQIKKILDDNGCPDDGQRSLIINTAAGVKLRGQAGLTANYAAGTTETLRRGVLLPIFGMDIRESAQVAAHTKGTAAGYDCTAVEPIGETTIACDGSDTTGTILAGDVVTNTTAADGVKYVVNDGSTLTGKVSGNFIINKPGLVLATSINDEWTTQGSYRANLAFHKSAIQLITRAPLMPEGGDAADDVMIVTDPVSGISFQIALYRQYRQVHFEVGLAWGYAAIKPEHMAILLG
jgi:hypothetical protein